MKHQDEIEKNEPPVREEELMQEILPLLEDYFIGEFSLNGKEILYRLPNGQRLIITAQTA